MVANCTQLFPAAVGCHRLAVARSGIQVCSTSGAKPPAILAALNESWCSEQPGLSYRWCHIERMCARIERKNIGIIRSFLAFRGEDEMLLLRHIHPHVFETSAARHLDNPSHSPAEIEPAGTGG